MRNLQAIKLELGLNPAKDSFTWTNSPSKDDNKEVILDDDGNPIMSEWYHFYHPKMSMLDVTTGKRVAIKKLACNKEVFESLATSTRLGVNHYEKHTDEEGNVQKAYSTIVEYSEHTKTGTL
ncbi:MAG: hypothetical protein DRR06_19165 [Gammaproteobacteria bacterium]|nr:MAG: hypothetical protein DRR06_19165 [Gammaproteobacteria bacterium]